MHICIVCWNAAPSPLARCPRCNETQDRSRWPALPWPLPGHKHLTLQSFHSAGGQGVVYRATDSALDKEVAVKLVPRHLTQESYEDEIDRFAREKAAMDFISHAASLPMFVDVYDFHRGSQEPDLDAAPAFLEMEFIQWPTLGNVIKGNGKLPTNTVFLVALELAQALRIMSRRIIHNDIKPDNLFVNIQKDKVELKVADFGIWVPDDDKVVTQVGAGHGIAGTIAYMSPEQSSGDRWDSRSDIYAACCVIWRCCTGSRPFPKTASNLPLFEQLKERRKLTQKFPDRPDSMPPELYGVLRKGLQHVAHERHKNANEFRSHLQEAYRKWRMRVDEERRSSLAKLENYAAAIAEQRQRLSTYYLAYVELSGFTSGVDKELDRLRDEREGAFDPDEQPLDISRVKSAIDKARGLLTTDHGGRIDDPDDSSESGEPSEDGVKSTVSANESTSSALKTDPSTKVVFKRVSSRSGPVKIKPDKAQSEDAKADAEANDAKAKTGDAEPGDPEVNTSKPRRSNTASTDKDERARPIETSESPPEPEPEPGSRAGAYVTVLGIVALAGAAYWYSLDTNRGTDAAPTRGRVGAQVGQTSAPPPHATLGAVQEPSDASSGSDGAALLSSTAATAAGSTTGAGGTTESGTSAGTSATASTGTGTDTDADTATGTGTSTGATSDSSSDALPDAEARKAQWLESALSASEQRHTYGKKARIQERTDGDYRLSFSGVTCGLQFGSDGNPERLKNCKNSDDDWWYLNKNIKLKCKKDWCGGRYEWFDNREGGTDTIWLRIKK